MTDLQSSKSDTNVVNNSRPVSGLTGAEVPAAAPSSSVRAGVPAPPVPPVPPISNTTLAATSRKIPKATVVLVLALVVFVGVVAALIWLAITSARQSSSVQLVNEMATGQAANQNLRSTDGQSDENEAGNDVDSSTDQEDVFDDRFESEAEFERYLELKQSSPTEVFDDRFDSVDEFEHYLTVKQSLPTECQTNRVGEISVAVDIVAPGQATMLYWFMFEKLGISPEGSSPYSFVYRDATGNELDRLSVAGSFDSVAGRDDELKVAIPYVNQTSKIELYYENGQAPIAEKVFSPCMPVLAWVDDPAGKTFTDSISVSWVGLDPDEDGEELEYLINLRRGDWELVKVIDVTQDEKYTWQITDDIAPGTYRLGLFASDGVNTGALFSKDFVIQ